MKCQKAVNIWDMSANERLNLQPGQWVYAGRPEDKGIWLGQKESGSQVVAWYANAKSRKSFREYVTTLRSYARGMRK